MRVIITTPVGMASYIMGETLPLPSLLEGEEQWRTVSRPQGYEFHTLLATLVRHNCNRNMCTV